MFSRISIFLRKIFWDKEKFYVFFLSIGCLVFISMMDFAGNGEVFAGFKSFFSESLYTDDYFVKPVFPGLYKYTHLGFIIFFAACYISSLFLYAIRRLCINVLSGVIGIGFLYGILAFFYAGNWTIQDSTQIILTWLMLYSLFGLAIAIRSFTRSPKAQMTG